MFIQLATILYVLVAVAMIALILMQRGAGAAAGSGFGAGASATVFGSRGASNFLSKATKWLAILFFVLSLGMAMYASRSVRGPAVEDLGVMGRVPAAATSADVPAAPVAEESVQSDVPVVPVEEDATEDDTQD